MEDTIENKVQISATVSNEKNKSLQALAQQPSVKLTPLTNCRVLVADDMEYNLLISRNVLERMGANVTEASNGKNALQELLKESFELAIIDIHMPDMSGHEVVTDYLANASKTGPIFAALSAHRTPDIEAQCIATGFDYFIEKPLAAGKLQTILNQFRADKSPPADEDLFIYLSRGNPTEIKHLQERFHRSCLAQLEKLRAAIHSQHRATTNSHIHKLKGLAGIEQSNELAVLIEQFDSTWSQELMIHWCGKLEAAITPPINRV